MIRKVYYCGLTPYRESHVGHLRGPIICCFISKIQSEVGNHLELISNITDTAGEINKAMRKEGLSRDQVVSKYMANYLSKVREYSSTPVKVVRVTEVIEGIISEISSLLALGEAEVRGDGVYHSGEGFAVWILEEGGFESPWGPGRPGWHNGCVAIIHREAPEGLWMHLGGCDLEVHHFNEEVLHSPICGCRAPLTERWLRYGLVVTRRGEKISKRDALGGALLSVREMSLDKPSARAFYLLKRFESPLTYSKEGVEEAISVWRKFSEIGVSLKGVKGEKGEEYEFFLGLLLDFKVRDAISTFFRRRKSLPAGERRGIYELIKRTVFDS